MRTLLLFVAALAASSTANAILPDNGWYWNPSESGRGFNIEIQNNVLFMAGFVYDQAGNQIWAVTGGPMSSDRFFSGTAYVTSGGQCVGCAYRPPTSTAIGNVTVSFSDAMHATVTFNGVPIQVQREPFGIDLTNPATPLLGEWATTEGSTGLYFGERLTLNVVANLSSGPTAGGTRTADSGVVVGQLTSSGWGMLLDSSISYWKLYTFSFTGFNEIVGIVSVFPKGSNPTGFDVFFGHRIQSAAKVQTGGGPGAKAARSDAEREQIDAATAARQAASTNRATPDLIELAKTLQAAIAR